MKRWGRKLALCGVLLALLSCPIRAFEPSPGPDDAYIESSDFTDAADTSMTVDYSDGTSAEITLSQTKSAKNQKTARKIYVRRDSNGKTLFVYVVTGYFRYDGTSAEVLGGATEYRTSAFGWAKRSDAYGLSKNQIYGKATFSGWNRLRVRTAGVRITCDEHGMIT